MYYRKKPVLIEALKWDGSMDKMEAINARWPEMRTSRLTSHPVNRTVQSWSIATLEGQHSVSVGDYIIKGVKGEFYPCKPDIFEMTYEAV
jgi:phage terminase large subunit-like protein